MSRSRDAVRSSASLATSASALIALVAIAAMMTAAPSTAAARISPIESRVTLGESGAVRAVAAAVVAAARELTATHPAPDSFKSASWSLELPPAAESRIGGGIDFVQIIRLRHTAARLLDLPPPVR